MSSRIRDTILPFNNKYTDQNISLRATAQYWAFWPESDAGSHGRRLTIQT
jgi:hypothetical protein